MAFAEIHAVEPKKTSNQEGCGPTGKPYHLAGSRVALTGNPLAALHPWLARIDGPMPVARVRKHGLD